MKPVAIKKQFMLTLNDIFDVIEPIDPAILFKDLPLRPALETISNLLFRLSNIHKDDLSFHPSNLTSWMMTMTGPDQNRILEFIQSNNLFNQPDFVLTDKRSCLQLLQIILLNCKSDSETLSKIDYSNLLKGLLFCNSLEIENQKDVFDWDGTGDADDFSNKILPVKMRNLELDRRKDYKIQFMKVFYFF